MRTDRTKLALLVVLAVFPACEPNAADLVFTFQADRFDGAEWSPPVNLGPVLNSSAGDMNAGLSQDQHTMYFVSDRTGGLGGTDIWISRRQCIGCPWETPVNPGAPINSDAGDGAPTVSTNGHMFFFFSSRAGGQGLQDIYVSHRISTNAEGDVWGAPVNLGPDVNTTAGEQGTYYVREGPTVSLYFNRPSLAGNTDIYRVSLGNDGMPLGPAVFVPELSDAAAADQKVAVRTDGKELLMSSARAGGLGGQDIWVSFRGNHHDAWSTPTNVGASLNTPGLDSQPNLSHDGQTLIFTSARPGGSGGNDLWMTTRHPGGR